MKLIIATALLALAATGAQAQTPSPSPSETRPAPRSFTRAAEIRIERPDLSLSVRCGDGESTKSCSETVLQLMEKLAATPVASGKGDRDDRRRREWDGDHRDRDRRPDRE